MRTVMAASAKKTPRTLPQAVQADAPLAYWRLEELVDAQASDSSGNGRSAVYTGTVSRGQAPLTSKGSSYAARFFPGWLEVADASWHRLNGSFSIELWVRVEAEPAASTFPGLVRRGGTGVGAWMLYYNSSRALSFWREGVSQFASAPTLPAAGTPAHVVVTYDQPTTTLKVYFDKVEQASARNTSASWASTSAASALRIATGDDTSIGDVSVDEVAFYDHALSAARVAAHYDDAGGVAGSVTPPATGSLWKADASATIDKEWCEGNTYDVNAGQGTPTTDAAWGSSNRVARVSSPAAPVWATWTKWWQLTIRDGDQDAFTAGAQRTELGQINPARVMSDGVDRVMHQGDHRFIAYTLQIPSSFTSGAWCALQQNKGQAGGNGPLGLYVWGGKIHYEKAASQTYGTTNTTIVWQDPNPVVRDQPIKLLVEVLWSTDSDGFYAIYGDLADGQGFRTLKAQTSGWTLKFGAGGGPVDVGCRIGIYRAAIPGTHSVLFGGFNVATSRAAATTAAFGQSL